MEVFRMHQESRARPGGVRGGLADTKRRLLVVENIIHAVRRNMDGNGDNAPIEK